MKKIVSILLAVAMVMACAVSAFATEAEVVEIDWAEIEAQAADTVAKGEFVNFDEIALVMWVPSVLAATELTDEDREQGYIAYFAPEDQSAAVSVMYVDVDGMTLEEYAATLAENGATDIEFANVNGLAAITYVLEETDTACAAFTTEAGYIFEVAGSPKSDEGFSAILSLMMASIQAEAEEEA